jgi:hypothetical protein
MRVLVAGGAGFIGSHVCETLLGRGHEVICLDNLITGRMDNIDHLEEHQFSFVREDVVRAPLLAVDVVLPARPQPVHYQPSPSRRCWRAGTHWRRRRFGRGRAAGVRSTSEVYSDPWSTRSARGVLGQREPDGPARRYDNQAVPRGADYECRCKALHVDRAFPAHTDADEQPPRGAGFAAAALAGRCPSLAPADRSFCYVSDPGRCAAARRADRGRRRTSTWAARMK